jgi:hypothetical protein
MWFRLSALALCGALVLMADVCRGLPAGPHTPSNYRYSVARPMSFRLLVKSAGPSFRITVRSLLRSYSDNPVHAGDIEVARCSDGRPLQLLPIMAGQPINFASTFGASDINFDGYVDFSVLGAFGGTWGSRLWWVYDPATGRFVQNQLTRELGELRANDQQIDPKKHEITAEYLMAGCPLLITRYRVEDNRLIKVHEEIGKQMIEASPSRRDSPAGVPCTVTVSDLVAGTMRVTEVRRFVDGEPVK